MFLQTAERTPEEGAGLVRRDVVKAAAVLPFTAWLSFFPAAEAEARSYGAYSVAFKNQHTGEGFSGVYRVGNKYLPEAFERINFVLRDFRTDEVFPIDPRVVDIIHVLHRMTGMRRPYEVLSGYRSPKTNAMLRNASSGVAKKSLHMTGQAMDVRLPGFATSKLRDLAVRMRAGGVGFYARSDFVHVDTGPIRRW